MFAPTRGEAVARIINGFTEGCRNSLTEGFSKMKLQSKVVSTCAAMIATFLALPICSSIAQSGAGNAAQSNPEYSGPRGSTLPPTIDDVTLKQTARAFVKVRQISQSEQRAVNDAGDDAAKQKAAQQAEAEKVNAVKAEGMQPQQYNQVLEIVRADKNLQQRFMSYVDNSANSPNNNM
jgi:hypothetical protein